MTGVGQSRADQNIRIYPNPATDKLYIAHPDQVNGLEVLTVTGNKVLSKILNESETELDISTLPPGIYLLKLFNGMK